MQRVIDTVAGGIGRTIGLAAESGLLFAAFGAIWVVFGIGLVMSQGSVDAAWQWIRALPLVLQGVVWVLFLPVMVGLWIWETSWPLVLRLMLIVSVAGWNLLIFLPRPLGAHPERGRGR